MGENLTDLCCKWKQAWSWMNDGCSDSMKQALEPPWEIKEGANWKSEVHPFTIAMWHSMPLKKSFFTAPLSSLCSDMADVRLLSKQIVWSRVKWPSELITTAILLMRIKGECCSIYEFPNAAHMLDDMQPTFSSWPETQRTNDLKPAVS